MQEDFSRLPKKEIARLLRATQKAAREQLQRSREEATHSAEQALGIEEIQYHNDGRGNLVEGPAPQAASQETYVDGFGYIHEGPRPTDGGYQTGAEGLVAWALANSDDPDVRAALGPDALSFEVALSEASNIIVNGCFEKSGWNIVATDLEGNTPSLKFTLAGGALSRDKAIGAASKVARKKFNLDMQPTELTVPQLTEVALYAANAATIPELGNCAALYIGHALPALGGTRLDITDSTMLTNPGLRGLIVDACFFVWKNSPLAKGFIETDAAIDYVNEYIASREFITVTTFVEAWDCFKQDQHSGLGWKRQFEARKVEEEERPPSQDELESLTPEEIAELYAATRAERAKQSGRVPGIIA